MKWGENDYFSVVTLFQSLLSLFCQEMRRMRACRQRRSLPVFQTPHHVLSKKKFFFPCLRMTTQKSSSAKLCMNFLCFFKGFWELRAKAKSFQIFLWKSLAPCFFEVVALRVFSEKFMNLVRGYWNCKDHRATSTVVIICLLAVWISDLLPRMNEFSSVQFVPITQNAKQSQRCNLLQLCNQFFKCF